MAMRTAPTVTGAASGPSACAVPVVPKQTALRRTSTRAMCGIVPQCQHGCQGVSAAILLRHDGDRRGGTWRRGHHVRRGGRAGGARGDAVRAARRAARRSSSCRTATSTRSPGRVRADPSAAAPVAVGPARRQDAPDGGRGRRGSRRCATSGRSSRCSRTASSTARWSSRSPARRRVLPAIVWCPAEAVAPGRVRQRGPARLSVPDEPARRRARRAARRRRAGRRRRRLPHRVVAQALPERRRGADGADRPARRGLPRAGAARARPPDRRGVRRGRPAPRARGWSPRSSTR